MERRGNAIFTESYTLKDVLIPQNYDIGLPDFPRYEAFGRGAKREIGERDNWTCQGIDLMGGKCYWELMLGKPAKFNEGFMITGAHYPELHQKDEDHNPNHGRCLCTLCHAQEELSRNNEWGARQLINQNSILTWDREDSTGERWDISFADIKNLYESIINGNGVFQVGNYVPPREKIAIPVEKAKQLLGTRRGNRL